MTSINDIFSCITLYLSNVETRCRMLNFIYSPNTQPFYISVLLVQPGQFVSNHYIMAKPFKTEMRNLIGSSYTRLSTGIYVYSISYLGGRSRVPTSLNDGHNKFGNNLVKFWATKVHNKLVWKQSNKFCCHKGNTKMNEKGLINKR